MTDEIEKPKSAPKKAKPKAGTASTPHPAPAANDRTTGNSADPAGAAAPGATQALRDGASKLAKQATEKARDYVSEGKTRAGGALDEVSRMMGDAATTVDERLGAEYGQYARKAADGIARFSDEIKGKEIEDLLADAQGFVRKSPAVAIGIAAALGFVIARIVKAGFDGDDSAGFPQSGPDSGPESSPENRHADASTAEDA